MGVSRELGREGAGTGGKGWARLHTGTAASEWRPPTPISAQDLAAAKVRKAWGRLKIVVSPVRVRVSPSRNPAWLADFPCSGARALTG